MSATDEELRLADRNNFDHATYAMVIFSLSFLLYLLVTTNINLYRHLTQDGSKTDNNKDAEMQQYERISLEETQRQHPETIFDSSEH